MSARARLVATGWEAPLALEDAEAPVPESGQVLVRVEACGVCHRDLLDREGRFPFIRLPITPGHEAVGRVVGLGAGVRDFAVGARVGTMHRDACGACEACLAGATSLCTSAAWVFGILADGGYATHLVAPESALFEVPDDLDAAQAAVMHCTFGTAYRDLCTLGRLRAGERVLVTGASGGVGLAAVQIAARLGAEVTAVLRSDAHAARVRALGASRVIVDPKNAFHAEARPIDLALDTVGAPTFESAVRSLKVGGRVVVVGNVTREKASMNLGALVTFGLTVIGGSGATRAEMAALFALHAERPFEMPIAAALPLARADEAQRMVRAGGLGGRVVIVP